MPKSALEPIKQESEAVLKFTPQTLKKIAEKGPIDKDGDGDDPSNITMITIEIALNGFVVTILLDDGSEEKYVETDFDQVLSSLRSRF
jgi:hypothetical protein